YSDEELTKEYTVWNRDEDVTVYAKWTPTKYTITYNLDGGEAENPVEYTIESDDIKLNNPEKEGHRFVDWKDGEDHSLGMEVTIPKGSTGNKVFNAFYEKEQYKITIGEKELIVDYGTAVDVTGAEYKLEKEGYEFLGYFYEDSPVENIIVRDNIVLTPKFKFIYKMLSSVQTYELNSNKDVVLKANGEIDNLREIMVDNTALLAEQDVTITEGSTIATIHASFLNTLAAGEHTVTFVYNDGEVTAPLNVTEYKEAAPKTGDNIMKNVYTLICSTMTFGLSIVLKKKFD
ncbi:MAG: InlB B-repeat-containing protein, partial [Bacilli bacterium]|nr:InlB B-repeat-containing protein [Bacilli bacterium]